MSLRDDVADIIDQIVSDVRADAWKNEYDYADEILKLIEPKCEWDEKEGFLWSNDHSEFMRQDPKECPFCPVCGKKVVVKG